MVSVPGPPELLPLPLMPAAPPIGDAPAEPPPAPVFSPPAPAPGAPPPAPAFRPPLPPLSATAGEPALLVDPALLFAPAAAAPPSPLAAEFPPFAAEFPPPAPFPQARLASAKANAEIAPNLTRPTRATPKKRASRAHFFFPFSKRVEPRPPRCVSGLENARMRCRVDSRCEAMPPSWVFLRSLLICRHADFACSFNERRR